MAAADPAARAEPGLIASGAVSVPVSPVASMEIQAAIARGPSELSVDTLTIEDPAAGEILVKMVATGVCHTDISALRGILPVPMPMVLGHEGAGVVAKVGAGVGKCGLVTKRRLSVRAGTAKREPNLEGTDAAD